MSLSDILKIDKIIKIHPQENLSSALGKLSTSHDAAFIFSDDDKYMGVINPYYCLIKSSFPGNAKVEHCIYHAPRVQINYSIKKIAGLFMQSKIHYLPVFDERDKFLGIISARHILSQFKNLPMFKVKISEILKIKRNPLVVINEDDTISTAVNTFKSTKLSKLIVVGQDLKLKGIISYYDLIAYLVTPKSSPERGERVGNKISFYHLKVKNFDKRYVLTLTPEHLLIDVVHYILDKKIGSVIIVDHERHPIGIITTKDLLRFFMKEQEQRSKIEVISKNLSERSRQIVGGFFYYISSWIKKIPDLYRARLFIKEEKQGGLFKVVLSLFPKKGQPQVIKREGKNLAKVLKKIKKD